MCTVSYLPTPDGFILTSNRDESPDRGISDVDNRPIGGSTVHFPRDPVAGGSWFAFAENGNVACLLNGAYEPYDRSRTFSISRGIVMLDSFRFDSPGDFVESYDFTDTAPFTLVLERGGIISEIVWDGQSTILTPLDAKRPQFWSSVTLYPEPVRKWRRKLFSEWLEQHDVFTQQDIMEFHQYGGKGDEHNDFVMNRGGIVQTLSISSVRANADAFIFRHINLDSPDDAFYCRIDKSQTVASGS